MTSDSDRLLAGHVEATAWAFVYGTAAPATSA
jgi:hypothetical protein